MWKHKRFRSTVRGSRLNGTMQMMREEMPKAEMFNSSVDAMEIQAKLSDMELEFNYRTTKENIQFLDKLIGSGDGEMAEKLLEKALTEVKTVGRNRLKTFKLNTILAAYLLGKNRQIINWIAKQDWSRRGNRHELVFEDCTKAIKIYSKEYFPVNMDKWNKLVSMPEFEQAIPFIKDEIIEHREKWFISFKGLLDSSTVLPREVLMVFDD